MPSKHKLEKQVRGQNLKNSRSTNHGGRADVDVESSDLWAVSRSMTPTSRQTKLHAQSMLPIWASVAAAPSEINGRDLLWLRVQLDGWRDDEETRARGQPALTLTCPRLLILSHGVSLWLGVEKFFYFSPPSGWCIHLYSTFLLRAELSSEVGLLSTRFRWE